MNVKTTLSITEARKKIYKISNSAQVPGTYYTLTENGRPKVVVMSAEEFESLQETLEVMHEFPDLKSDIQKAENAIKLGEYITFEDLLAKEGLKLIKENEISNNHSKKGSKKNR